jgi:hypothetical protein
MAVLKPTNESQNLACDELIEESSSESAGALQRESLDYQVIFIQLYRDYTRSPWSGLADQGFLEIFIVPVLHFTFIQDVN